MYAFLKNDADEFLYHSLGIAPWNSPLILTLRAMAIPVICGNTVVLKSSEVSPRTQYVIAELFHEVCRI